MSPKLISAVSCLNLAVFAGLALSIVLADAASAKDDQTLPTVGESFMSQLPPGAKIRLWRTRLRDALRRDHGQVRSAEFIDRFKKVAEAIAVANTLPVDYFVRLIERESEFNPNAVSAMGAQGIAQFMPGTAAERGLKNPFDPDEALSQSAALLKELSDRFGNFGLAAAAYNSGPRRVQEWLSGQSRLPAETVRYVRAITGRDVEFWAEREAALIKPGFDTAQSGKSLSGRRKPDVGNWELVLLRAISSARSAPTAATRLESKAEQSKLVGITAQVGTRRREPRIAAERRLCASCIIQRIY